ncbi:unnamed protein product [Cochlearia groenlandica]
MFISTSIIMIIIITFGVNGEFKILKVADMHFANGATIRCLDVLPNEKPHCSDLNTTSFMTCVIAAEKPDLIIFFTGDNIFGFDLKDAVKSLKAAFAPAIASKIPWVAVLGNHDQESTSIGSKLLSSSGSITLGNREYNAKPNPQQGITPEFQLKERYERSEARRYILCYYRLGVYSRRVKSVFVGHDHLNDFCGKHKGLNLCYGGGFGYHGYGKAGWSRRARVVAVDLNKKRKGKWVYVKSIRTLMMSISLLLINSFFGSILQMDLFFVVFEFMWKRIRPSRSPKHDSQSSLGEVSPVAGDFGSHRRHPDSGFLCVLLFVHLCRFSFLRHPVYHLLPRRSGLMPRICSGIIVATPSFSPPRVQLRCGSIFCWISDLKKSSLQSYLRYNISVSWSWCPRDLPRVFFAFEPKISSRRERSLPPPSSVKENRLPLPPTSSFQERSFPPPSSGKETRFPLPSISSLWERAFPPPSSVKERHLSLPPMASMVTLHPAFEPRTLLDLRLFSCKVVNLFQVKALKAFPIVDHAVFMVLEGWKSSLIFSIVSKLFLWSRVHSKPTEPLLNLFSL